MTVSKGRLRRALYPVCLLASLAALTAHGAYAQDKADSTPAAPLPVEAFAQLPFVESPELSPDGTKIAAKVAIAGSQRLVIMARVNGETKSYQVGTGDNDLNWWQWVNDDWLVAGIGAELPVEGDPWYIRRAIGIKADGTVNHPIGWKIAAQNADDVLWVARDGSPRIKLALQRSIYSNGEGFWPEVYEADISTGKISKHLPSREYVSDWYADATGIVRMGLGYVDRTRTAQLYYRDTAKESFKLVAKANQRADEALRAPALFLAEPGKALSFDNAEGFRTLRGLDIAGLSFGETLFSVPGYDMGSIISDAAGTGLSGVTYTDTRRRVKWMDPTMLALQDQLDKAVGAARQARIVSWDRARTRYIVEVGAPDRPSAYYTYDPKDGVMQILARTYEKLPNRSLSPVRSLRYKARDGLEVEAVLTVPKGREAKKLPLILMPHGGPFARDLEEWDWIVQFLADRGYAVVQPNYRGSSGYGTAFAEKGEGQWGLAMQDDLNDAVDHLVKEGIADPGRVCIVGASYGGYAAMRGAHRDRGRYRCAVSYAGVSDLGAMMRYDSRFLNSGGRKDWMKEQAPDYKSVSPVNYAAEVSTPILLMHGKKDRRVPVKQSREMAEKLKQAGKPYSYIEQPLGDHFFSREEDRLQFLKEIEAFLGKHNPA